MRVVGCGRADANTCARHVDTESRSSEATSRIAWNATLCFSRILSFIFLRFSLFYLLFSSFGRRIDWSAAWVHSATCVRVTRHFSSFCESDATNAINGIILAADQQRQTEAKVASLWRTHVERVHDNRRDCHRYSLISSFSFFFLDVFYLHLAGRRNSNVDFPLFLLLLLRSAGWDSSSRRQCFFFGPTKEQHSRSQRHTLHNDAHNHLPIIWIWKRQNRRESHGDDDGADKKKTKKK